MKKSDLKTGMWVVLRDDSRCIVQLNFKWNVFTTEPQVGDVAIDMNNGYINLKHYKEDLTNKDVFSRDVVQVRKARLIMDTFNFNVTELLWERKEEPITLTQKERDMLDLISEDDIHWLARDEEGDLCIFYKYEPYKNSSSNFWINGLECTNFIIANKDYFKFIEWTDEKPWSISDLLKLNVKN